MRALMRLLKLNAYQESPVKQKPWRKPEVRTLKAGAAETSSGTKIDTGGSKPNHS